MCITLARRPCFTPYSKPCDTKTCLTLESSVLYRLRLLMVSVASVVLVNACVAPGPSICGSQNTEELPRNETSRRLVDPWEKFVLGSYYRGSGSGSGTGSGSGSGTGILHKGFH